MNMKRTNSMLGICLLASAMTACVEGNLSPDSDNREPSQQPVPITLQAGSRTKAVVNPGEAFNPLLVCFRLEGMYEKPIWTNNAAVNATGIVSFAGFEADEGPLYPDEGPFDVYISGLHPQGADLAVVPGSAQYAIDGTQDVMYAPEVFGNYQDGHRIHGNTDPSKDKPLVFEHLLTQLQFKAYLAAGANPGGGAFRINKITLKKVPASVRINLADGSLTAGETTKSLDAPVQEGVDITSTNPEAPVSIGYALLPAANSYMADLTTNMGMFTNIEIKTKNGNQLGPGLAHTILFVLNGNGLIVTSVTAATWLNLDSGTIDI